MNAPQPLSAAAPSAHAAPSDVIDALRGSGLFDHLGAERLAALADRGALRRRFAAGARLFERGSHGHALMILVAGRVRIDGVTTDGRPVTLETLSRPGALFGETAVLGFTRRIASAVAEGEVRVIEIEKAVVERLDRDMGGHAVRDAVRGRAHRRAFRVFCAGHVYLQTLSPQVCSALAARTRLRTVKRGEPVFDAGESAERVVLLRAGLARLWRARGARTSVLGYFNPGDVFVPPDLMHGISRPEDARWPDALTAQLHVEVFEIERAAFVDLPVEARAVFVDAVRAARAQSEGLRALVGGGDDPARTLAAMGPGATVFGLIEAVEQAGALEARSLLTIDLETCVRCGNCVRACQSRHGHARMVRQGPVVRARKRPDRPGEHRRTLLPGSCQHCEKPDCMVDCPTGAIHRKSTGEVAIDRARCIGCGHCARNCPWGNIAMVPAPRAGDGLLHQLLTARLGGVRADGLDPYGAVELRRVADKCDLCADHAQANCVHNCPTGAILRVEPARFFEPLQAVVRRADEQAGDGATVVDRPARTPAWLRWSLTLFALVGLALLAAAGDFDARSLAGRWVGAVALAAMLASAALGVRRGLARARRQGGRYRTWVAAHLSLGAIACGGALLHAGADLGGPLTGALWVLAALEGLMGLAGVLLYRWIPRAIGRTEGASQLEETLLEERSAVERRMADLTTPSRAERIGGLPRGSVIRCLTGRADHDALRRAAEPTIRHGGGSPEAVQLYVDGLRRVEITAALYVYRLRRVWLALHVGLAVALTVGALTHVVAVIRFWGLGA